MQKLSKNFKIKKHGFTLAEVLIVIGVIGVVAAITIPTLIPLIKEKVNSNRKEVIEDRLIQGMNQLNTLDDGFNASQYEDTEGFVRALSKYYRMSQICGADELRNCFPYDKMNYTLENKDGALNINNLKTPESFKLKSSEYFPPAGFISSQGTSFLMLLKKDCIMDTGEVIRGIPTSCVQYMYDNNGSGLPNKIGMDIKFSSGIKFPTPPDGTLAVKIGDYSTYLILNYDYHGGNGTDKGLNTCEGQADHVWDERTNAQNNICSNNRMAAGKKACSEAGYYLPKSSELGRVYCRVRGISTYSNCDSGTSCYNSACDAPFDDRLAAAVAKKSSIDIWFWSSTPAGIGGAYTLWFKNGMNGRFFVSDTYAVICLGK